MTPAPRWLVRAALAMLVGATAIIGGCDDAGPPAERDTRCVVSFDGYVYVEASAATPTVLERIQHQQQSIASSLRRRHIGVDARRQGVDVRTLSRETVRVLDSESGSREMIRVRYRVRQLARAPKSETSFDWNLAALQNDASALRDEVAAACVPPNERSAGAAPWKSFDADLPSCIAAVTTEQRRLTALRTSVASPAEVTRVEVERRYLPIAVRVRPRRPKPSTPAPMPRARGASSGKAEPEPATPRAAGTSEPIADADPLAEPPAIDDGYDDVPEAHGAAADEAGAGDPASGAPDHAGSKWLEPNYYVLACVAIALVVLLRRKRRR